ncbi:DNA primase/helicase [Bordetella phage vB_BbrP_BB8]|uniref:DNA helicase/primase n=1 Tax=Bordetella phage vB_BbrP_BB8 TaxID=2587820 RepID=A0A4Y5TQZ7_9CAUD|nr:DNA primase/helicase [Bordetella phage vB_BbrP_BB8]
MSESESYLVRKEPCPKCGSRDNLARYSDGHAHCFGMGCDYYEKGDGEVGERQPRKQRVEGLVAGEFRPLMARKITEETARKFGYTVGDFKGKTVQIAPYHDASGAVVAQKLRFADKSFTVAGESKRIGDLLFGAHLWSSGKKIVITEGEIDAMSVSQAQGNKWPVVSVPNGAQGAKKSLQKNLEYLAGFEEVILMFDMDDAGRAAVEECAPLFPPGKCKVASLPMKDANDLLKAGREQEIIQAIWNAKPYRPDGIVSLADIKEKALQPPVMGLPWFLEKLTAATYGRRYGELYCLGAGTGVGKTDFLTQQIEYDLNTLHESVGVFFLEQSPVETVQRIAGKYAGKMFHVPDSGATTEELSSAISVIEANGKLFLYDSWGATDWEVIRNKIRFLNHSEGVRIFYIDHLTALAAMEEDEKTALEEIMAEMAGLTKELDIVIHLVSHLATPEGKPHEEGGRVMIRHFKGSRAIGFWSHFLFGIERSQQDEEQRNRSVFRVLKDRYTGRATGLCIPMIYDPESGRLSEADEAPVFKDETGEKPEF